MQNINNFEEIIRYNPFIYGLNITIPFKRLVVKYITDLNNQATAISAVNTLKIKEKYIIGYNTDAFGFKKSFVKYLQYTHKIKKTLVVGNGGAALAVIYILKQLKVPYLIGSFNFKKYKIIIQCTPLGTFPTTYQYPLIPYHDISTNHYFYDLIYNPVESKFLKKGANRISIVKNGLEMLQIQAEFAWYYWISN